MRTPSLSIPGAWRPAAGAAQQPHPGLSGTAGGQLGGDAHFQICFGEISLAAVPELSYGNPGKKGTFSEIFDKNSISSTGRQGFVQPAVCLSSVALS